MTLKTKQAAQVKYRVLYVIRLDLFIFPQKMPTLLINTESKSATFFCVMGVIAKPCEIL